MIAKVKITPEEGVSAGGDSIKTPFSGNLVKDVKGMNDVNGLTNEFMKVYNAVRARWTQGLGKYLLVKLADSMAKGGILEVGKVGCRINHYQRFLTKLSEKLPAVRHHAAHL